MTVVDKFIALEADLNGVLLERAPEVHSAILALVAKRHMFMVGPPGVAKSMLVNELVKRIEDMDKNQYFKWLLTKHTTPEELYGPPDFTLMRDQGIYRRVTAKKLPEAHYSFLDEVFKANSAILNSLLTILNEGEFENHTDDARVPLNSLFAASNEIPTTAELAALADRLHFWHHTTALAEPSNFAQMLAMGKRDPEAFITLSDIEQANAEVQEIPIADTVFEVLVELRRTLNEEGIVASDRRFHQSIEVIKAEAWIKGHEEATVVDCRPLQHMMWRDISQIDTVRKIVLDMADPLERDILDVLSELESVYHQFQRDLDDADVSSRKAMITIEAYQKVTAAKGDYKELKARVEESNNDYPSIERLRKRIKEIGPILMEQGQVIQTQTKSLLSGDED